MAATEKLLNYYDNYYYGITKNPN